MKFEVVRASKIYQDNKRRPCQNAELIGKYGLVLGFRNDEEDINHITIYDDYIE